jgi:hypothetical protein
MQLSRRNAAALVALALAVLPARAHAASTGGRDLRIDGQTAINNGLALIRKVLHLDPPQDDVLSHSISLSSREASLDLELTNGHSRSIALRAGSVYVDGQVVGNYAPGGALDRSWRRALAEGGSLDTRALLTSLHAWHTQSLPADEAAARTHIDDALRGLDVKAGTAQARDADARIRAELQAERHTVRLNDLAALDTIGRQLESLDDAGADIAQAVRNAPVRLGDVTVDARQRVDGDLVVYKGGADVFGEVTGNVVSLFGDVTLHRGALIGKNAVSVGGSVNNDGATIRGDVRTIAREDLDQADVAPAAAATVPRSRQATSAIDHVFRDVRDVLAVFIALAMLGFGTVFFGRRYLEVTADTATHSFGRSFVVGLLGQLLLLPTFAMLIVGLVCTVVGILLLPFAVVAFVIAAIVAAVGGYLAVAHAIGETFTRRRMAHGAFVRAPNAYGYLFAGLIGLLGLWAAAALTGWMGPVVIVFRIAAVIVTWIAMTTGFGAVLLSRAGLRETFAGRHVGEMSDEYLWATPPATPTAARMKMDKNR